MDFPQTRMRRMRRTPALRALVRETRLEPGQLIYPLFLVPGEGVRKPIASMPGVFNLSVDEALKEAAECAALGLGGVLLFGLPAEKDEAGSGAWAEDGIVQTGLRAMKRERGLDGLVTIADVCLCEYTSHGHCGVVRRRESEAMSQSRDGRSLSGSEPMSQGRDMGHPGGSEFEIENDASVELLARTAVSLARAGADVVAPSDMMDGRVGAIREALDRADCESTPVLSYAAKFASAFYGPFREAADSAPQFGDRRSYQMDGANRREAMREVEADLREGADMLLMKPAMPYLDVIADVRGRVEVPMGAYQVSGEFSMLQAAFERGWLERERAMLESLLSIRRAGADFIVTYFAKEAARHL